MQCTVGELNKLDFGTHMHLMEEWNDSSRFEWEDALVMYEFPNSVVIHPHKVDGGPGIMVAVYRTQGEGHLLSLRCYTPNAERGQHDYVFDPTSGVGFPE